MSGGAFGGTAGGSGGGWGGGPVVRVAFVGDVVGRAGREAFARAMPALRREWRADVVVVNVENAKHGRGPGAGVYRELMNTGGGGPDWMTLGDHALDDPGVREVLREEGARISRPWRMTGFGDGERRVGWAGVSSRSAVYGKGVGPIAVVTVLGRAFMAQDWTDGMDPFAQVDEAVAAVRAAKGDALVLVEVHAEATSEKQAVAHHCAREHGGVVFGVVGTHTHAQTNDARVIGVDGLDGAGVAAVTDVGCTGGEGGVIGFDAGQSIARLRAGRGQIHPVEGDGVVRGALIELDVARRGAVGCSLLVERGG